MPSFSFTGLRLLLSLTPFLLGTTITALPSTISVPSKGQFPVINGLIAPGRDTAPQPAAKNLGVHVGVPAKGKSESVLSYVENSGVCETTPGVYTASGYVDVDTGKHMFFWFFAARNNPDTAPLTIWLNGGPGSSSMIGLFQELGPCRINNASDGLDLNPNSWNTNSNVIFWDQPIGAGYSYGTSDVGTSEEAAAEWYTAMQLWLKDPSFSKLKGRDTHLWTESYGGHYGPAFSKYILAQNQNPSNIAIPLKSLGIGNGLTDPLTQYPQYLEYAAHNPFHPLVSTSTLQTANTSLHKTGGCMDQIKACAATKLPTTCSGAQSYCNSKVLQPLAGNWDVYYVPTANPDPYPPDLTAVLNGEEFMEKIGAKSKWEESNSDVYYNFLDTGDWMVSQKEALKGVIDLGLRVHLFDGEADYICNYMGVEAMINSLSASTSATYASTAFADWKVEGVTTGLFKNAENFSYVRVYGAGHEVPAYGYGGLEAGKAALAMFDQVISGQSITNS